MSKGPWKKHKYFQKIGEGANAVYRYTKKNVAGRVTGDYYDEKAKEAEGREKHYEDLSNMQWDAGLKSAQASNRAKTERDRKINSDWLDYEAIPKYGEINDKRIAAWKEKRENEKKAENSIGEKITGKRAKAKMEKYAKNEMKGDDSRYIDEKNKYEKSLAGRFAKAKKKLKHSDLDYQETVMHGQMLIDQLLGKKGHF